MQALPFYISLYNLMLNFYILKMLMLKNVNGKIMIYMGLFNLTFLRSIS